MAALASAIAVATLESVLGSGIASFVWVVEAFSEGSQVAISAPATPAGARTWTPSRTPWGHPDLQGMWTNQMSTHAFADRSQPELKKEGTAAPETRPNGNRDRASITYFHDAGRPGRLTYSGGLVDPADGRLPLQPWAAAKRNEINKNSDDPKGNLNYVDPRALCYLPGVPFSNYATPYNGYQIVQTPERVLILSEWNHTYRHIPLNGRPHVGQNIRLWMGDSRGRWEGDTLVVDVTNFNDKTWLSGDGEFHSEALHIVERFTLIDGDTIRYEATVEDPKVFTRPWTLAFNFNRAETGYELFEYACHEGNRAPELILNR